VQAGCAATIDRYIGYYEPYASSHVALDQDKGLQQEVRNAARTLIAAVRQYRSGGAREPDIRDPRPK
jgi:hypothetical protein